MIKYQLNCKKCNNTFDSWFASSKEFEKLKKLKLITCNNCNSIKIEKSIMSPRISSNFRTESKQKTLEKKKRSKIQDKRIPKVYKKQF